jgi:hypothetical protein
MAARALKNAGSVRQVLQIRAERGWNVLHLFVKALILNETIFQKPWFFPRLLWFSPLRAKLRRREAGLRWPHA